MNAVAKLILACALLPGGAAMAQTNPAQQPVAWTSAQTVLDGQPFALNTLIETDPAAGRVTIQSGNAHQKVFVIKSTSGTWADVATAGRLDINATFGQANATLTFEKTDAGWLATVVVASQPARQFVIHHISTP